MANVNYTNYCSIEMSKLLKEFGYPQECSSENFYKEHTDGDENIIVKPTFEQAKNWLRKEKTRLILIDYNSVIKLYSVKIINLTDDNKLYLEYFHSYEEAEEAGIMTVLRDLKLSIF